jgi:hypothetical protein
VDHGRQQLKGSPERGLGAAPVSESSPAMGENEEETSEVPTVGEGGGDLLSMTRVSGRGEEKVGAALEAVECGRGGGTFYMAEEATDGRGDSAVRGTAGGASSTCRLWEWRRGGGHLMRGK